MAQYLTPGVYVEEIDTGPKPIEGVATSIAGAVGVTERGPNTAGPLTGKPELVTSFAEFVRKFGGFLPQPDPPTVNKWALNATEGGRWWLFPLSVKGFFDNGGQQLFVKRVVSRTASPASGNAGTGITSELAASAGTAATRIRLRHLLGIQNGSTIDIYSNGAAVAGSPFTVNAYDSRDNSVTLTAAVGKELRPARDFVVPTLLPLAPPPPVTVTFRPKTVGLWGNSLRVQIRPVVSATLRLLADPTSAVTPETTTLTADALGGATALTVASIGTLALNDHVVILGEEYVLVAPAPAGTTINIDRPVPAGATWSIGTSVRRLRPAAVAGATAVNASNASQLYVDALVELDDGTNKEVFTVNAVTGDRVTLSGALANAYYEDYRLRLVEAEVNVRYAPNGVLADEETFTNLRLASNTPEQVESLSNFVTNVNTLSKYVRLALGPGFASNSLAAFPAVVPAGAVANTLWLPLTGGSDNYNGLTPDDFVGVDGGSGNRTGIQSLEDIDEIAICMAPNIWSSTVQSALIQHCEILKDRFGILDPQDGLSIERIRDVREAIDTKYAALYYPWIEVRDPSVGRNVYVAPSGHVAGIYARVDVDRGVHKAPANEVIRGITKIAQEVTFREQALLNPKGINALRFFPNRGNRVWGARTLTSDMSWKYVNVRRLFIFVEESIDEGTQWVVFEPNDDPTWARVRQTITNFLIGVWRSGALEGTKQDEAFFVKCDRTTMTQDDIDNGRLICIIGIAPVKPAEFVIFRIQQKTRDARG
jgi:Bacteriophage tail sheath protein